MSKSVFAFLTFATRGITSQVATADQTDLNRAPTFFAKVTPVKGCVISQ